MASLEEHKQLLGRVVLFLHDQGLSPTDVKDDMACDLYQGTALEGKTDSSDLKAIIQWLRDQHLITFQNSMELIDGGFHYVGVQLTSKGISLVRNQEIEELSREASTASPESNGVQAGADRYSKIGSLIGGMVGGFVQAVS